MCRSSKASQKQQQKLRNSKQNTSQEVHFSKRDNERKSRVSPPKKYDKYGTQNRCPAQRLCKYCGGKHARDKYKCPAYGETCSKCKKMNHYARVFKLISKPRGNRNVNKISDSDNEEEYNEENYSKEDSDEYTFRLTHTVRAVNDKGTQWFVTLKMKANDHSRDVKCQIDTGTTCNVMNYMTYTAKYHKMVTQDCARAQQSYVSTTAQQCFLLVKPP